MEDSKRCARCKAVKQLAEFYKSSYYPSGYDCRCKDCRRKQANERYRRTRKKKDGVMLDFSTGRLIEHRGMSRRIFLNPSQIGWLKKNYSHTEDVELAEYLGISVRTMNRRAKELGLSKSKEFLRRKWRENAIIGTAVNKTKDKRGNFLKYHQFYGNKYTGKIIQ